MHELNDFSFNSSIFLSGKPHLKANRKKERKKERKKDNEELRQNWIENGRKKEPGRLLKERKKTY